jgi:thiol-disulfide isomerase/thioredoxin
MLTISKPVAIAMLVTILAATGCGRPHASAPDISFTLLDGRLLALDALAGKTVLVNFWASTCDVCMREMPEMITLYQDLAPAGLEIIAVAMPYDPPNRVVETSQRMHIPYPVALDIAGKAVSAFGGVQGTPAFFLISAQGEIDTAHTGAIDMAFLRARIGMLLATSDKQES